MDDTLHLILSTPALALYFIVRDYFRPMLVNPLGWFMLGLAALLLFVGNLIIRRLTAIA